MSVIDIILLVSALFVVVLASIKKLPQRFKVISIVAVLLIIIVQILLEGIRLSMLPIYLFTCVMLIGRIRAIFSNQPTIKKGKLLGLIIFYITCFVFCFALFFRLPIPSVDLRNETWPAAFARMHQLVSSRYAFGEYKKVGWDDLYNKYKPEIASAWEKKDKAAYYLALRQYAFSLPDSHINLAGNDNNTRAQSIGAGYGFNVTELNDGRIIACSILVGGPAEKAGLKWGAEIVTWNDQPIKAALKNVSVLWANRPPATLEGLQLEQLRFLTRAPAGTQAIVAFRNPDSASLDKARLAAQDDGLFMLNKTYFQDDYGSPVSYKTIDNSYGYLKITKISTGHGRYDPAGEAAKAVESFNSKNISGIIVDLRGNQGGMDSLVPEIMGLFYKDTAFYETTTIYMPGFKAFIRNPLMEYLIKPKSPNFSGRVAVLIDNGCVSSGEGIALAFKRLPQAKVIGFQDTNGSFGMMLGGEILLPGELTFEYPQGYSLDKDGNIQIDSNQALKGGITPDIKVPMTIENARAVFYDGRDVLLERAVEYLSNSGK